MTIVCFLALILPGLGLSQFLARDFPELNLAQRLILVMFFSLVITSGVSLLCAVLGIFYLSSIWGLLIFFSFLFIILYKRPQSLSLALLGEIRPLILLAICCFVFWLSFIRPPAEWMSNYQMDAGRYSNIASFILQNHSLELRNELSDLSFSLDPKKELAPFPGMFRTAEKTEIVYTGPYVHLFPSLLAFTRAHVGIKESFKLNWVLGILSTLVFYIFLKITIENSFLATFGALALFTNSACQLYFNRNMSEILAQLLIIGAFVSLALFQRKPSKTLAFLAAFLFFLLATCRLEFGILYSLIPLTYALIFFTSGEKPFRYFTIFLFFHLLFLIPLDWYYNHDAFSYVLTNSRRTLNILPFSRQPLHSQIKPWFIHIWLGINASILFLNLLVHQYFPGIFCCASHPHRLLKKFFPYFLVTLYTAFLAWNLFIRPVGGPIPDVSYQRGYNHNMINLLRLLHFQDGITLLLTIPGVYLLCKRNLARTFGIFVLVIFFLFILKSSHSPPIFWWIRRYVSIVIPGMYFLAALGLTHFRKYTKIILCTAILSFNVYGTIISIHPIREKPGLFQYYSELSQLFEKNHTQKDPSQQNRTKNIVQLCFGADKCSHAAVPLHSHFGIETLYLSTPLTENQIALMKALLNTEYTVSLTHSSAEPLPFSLEEEKLLHNSGLKLTLTGESRYGFDEPISLHGWKRNLPWTNLYYPASLLGVSRFQRQSFSTKIFRLDYQ